MRIKASVRVALLAAILVFAGCSTKKNTWGSRNYHAFTTRYNIFFNGNQSFTDGIASMNKAHQDDYSQLIPMFAISNHDNGKSIASNMDRTIEKCRKSIKKHSIKDKPKRNSKKYRDADYKNYYNQEEFNPMIKYAWLLLGQAEFHKADFMGAAGTFIYITKHFALEPYVVAEARIWLSRCYAEMGWLYEAEEVLDKINPNDVPRQLNGIYAASKADLLMKQGRYKEMMPFLQLATEKEKKGYQKVRYNFLLGQLALLEENKREAVGYFNQVVKATPPYLVEFNARLRMLESDQSNPNKSVKSLLKMAKNSNNKEYLEQIYAAVANIKLTQKDTSSAITYYKLGLTKSTRNGIDKAQVLVSLGDLYFQRKAYVDAAPCYEEAAQLMSHTNPTYPRISKLAETLGEVATNYNLIQLNDSLITLSKMSVADQRAVVDKIIAQVVKDEAEAKALAEAEGGDAFGGMSDSPFGGGMGNDMFGSASGDWYFYNPQLINSGRAEFQRRWGRRKLEDNWRRMVKNSVGGDLAEQTATTDAATDSTTQKGATKQLDDNKNPEFYLAQIPKNQEQVDALNRATADALYKMADVLKNKMNDYPEALRVYLDYQARFPYHAMKLESYYAVYQIYGLLSQLDSQNLYRSKLTSEFPESVYAVMLSQPDYLERMKKMLQMQDSLYANTYTAYSNSKYADVIGNYQYMSTNYPLSELMPKFSLLNALSLAKTKGNEEMYDALSVIVEKYPNSDVTPFAKDLIALVGQGRKSVQGTSSSNLNAKREQEVQQQAVDTLASKQLVWDEKAPYALVIRLRQDSAEVRNRQLYDLAAFNFAKFMIKDYDLNVRKVGNEQVLVVSGLDGLAETQWYEGMLLSEPLFMGRVTLDQCERIAISIDNLNLIGARFTWREYASFCEKQHKSTKRK